MSQKALLEEGGCITLPATPICQHLPPKPFRSEWEKKKKLLCIEWLYPLDQVGESISLHNRAKLFCMRRSSSQWDVWLQLRPCDTFRPSHRGLIIGGGRHVRDLHWQHWPWRGSENVCDMHWQGRCVENMRRDKKGKKILRKGGKKKITLFYFN